MNFFKLRTGAECDSPTSLLNAWRRFKNIEFDDSITFAAMNQRFNDILAEERELQKNIIAVKRFKDSMNDVSTVTSWVKEELEYEANHYSSTNAEQDSHYEDDIIIVIAKHYGAHDAVAAAKNENLLEHIKRNVASLEFFSKATKM